MFISIIVKNFEFMLVQKKNNNNLPILLEVGI